MQADARPKTRSATKIWLAVLSTITAGIAIVPPMIAAFRASPSASQNGNGNTAVIGSTVGSNNQTNNSYLSMWVEGARTIVGTNTRPAVVMPMGQAVPMSLQPALNPVVVAEFKEPEPGATGRIVTNASLMNEATWSPEPSRVPRLLTFVLRAEAIGSDEKPGTLDATLAREGRDICTVSLNTRTSPMGSGVRWADAVCTDTLPANGSATYKAKVKAFEMSPVAVRLTHVDSVKR
ncbi:MAG: hypothetical protein EOP36_05115 [Rubrivivax sp.]|nr:MAG: hypothetical protein EOP36_05115 [Rubrivivax sp.]